MSKTVAVLMGGFSAERDVSLASGEPCADALENAGYTVRRVDVTRDLAALLDSLTPAPDAVFNALHGRWGEDGAVQGILDMLRIPYTHSGRVASTLAMDKPLSIELYRRAGLDTARHVVMDIQDLKTGTAPLPAPYVVKPSQEGSSIGVTIVRDGANRADFSDWSFGSAMVEEFIDGKELTVSVMGGKALCVTELQPVSGFYDYIAKYTDGQTEHLCPAPIDKALADKCMDWAEKAHRALGCRGVSRSDFRYDPKTDRLVILETNTQPGMTPLSLVPEQAAHLGMSFEALVSWMVENAECDS